MKPKKFEILDNPNRENMIKEFIESQEPIDYNYIRETYKNATTRPDFHLARLVDEGLLERTKDRGYYRLNEISIQPLRDHFNEQVAISLIGGIGDISLFVDILNAFEEVSIIPKKYLIVTDRKISKEFKSSDKGKFSKVETEICELDYQKILRENYNKIYEELEKLIKKEIYNYEIICELTGGTKPVSLALMNLSVKYGLRRCYFSGRKITWI